MNGNGTFTERISFFFSFLFHFVCNVFRKVFQFFFSRFFRCFSCVRKHKHLKNANEWRRARKKKFNRKMKEPLVLRCTSYHSIFFWTRNHLFDEVYWTYLREKRNEKNKKTENILFIIIFVTCRGDFYFFLHRVLTIMLINEIDKNSPLHCAVSIQSTVLYHCGKFIIIIIVETE